VITPVVREKYRAMVQAHIAAVKKKLTDARIDYTMLDTTVPLDHALFHYLSAREHLTRGPARSGVR
jgi:hypothetical protein